MSSKLLGVLLVLAVGVLGCGQTVPAADRDASQPRVWTNSSGEHKVRATLVEVTDDAVRLKKASDGKIVTVPLAKLSEADQQWVAKHGKSAAATEGKSEEPATEAPAKRGRSTAGGSQGEWPGWLGPNRDGKSADTGLLKQWPASGPELLWKINDLGKGFSSVAVADGRIYVSGEPSGSLVLRALDMDGKPLWKAENGPAWTANYNGSRATPTYDSGNVYLLSGTGRLGCFDAATGKPRWAKEAREFGGSPGGWGYAESVLILGNLAIFKPGGQRCVVALDKSSGRPVWTSSGFSAGPEYSSCLAFNFGGGSWIVTGTNEGLVCVNAKNGSLAWNNKFAARNTANCPTPAFSDGHVFWANGYGKGGVCVKLSRNGASDAWTTRDMECHHGGYVIEDGYIYGNNGGGWACLELKTGKKQWSDKGVGKGSLCWADGMLYLFSEHGGQAALATCSPSGMKITGKVKVDGDGPSWAHPVVVGGRLYLRYDTNLYCFNVKAQ